MARHAADRRMRSWARVFSQAGRRGFSDAGPWAMAAVIAAIPAVIVGFVWFLIVGDLIADSDGALVNAVVAGLTTFVVMVAVIRSLTRVERPQSGRHLSD